MSKYIAFYYLDMRFLQQVKEFFAVSRDVCFGWQQIEDLNINVHRVW